MRDRLWLGRLLELTGNRVTLEGCRFDVGHDEISHLIRSRLLRGVYERSERAILREWLDPGAPVIELGGGIGVVSTLINRRLQNPRSHVVIEANPALIPIICRQRGLNGAAFTVLHAALDYSGRTTTWLHVCDGFISGRVSDRRQDGIEVPAITLQELLSQHPWRGVTLVCDIEGLETQLVEREGELLRRTCETLVLEVHPEFRTAAECEAMFTRLDHLGFRRVARVRKVHAFRRGAATRPG